MKLKQILFLLWLTIASVFNSPLYSQQIKKLLDTGDSLSDISSYDSAFHVYNAALKIADSTKDSVDLGNIFIRMGIVLNKQAIYSTALENFFKSLAIFKALQIKDRLATVYFNIGNVYRQLEDYKHGQAFLEQAYSEWVKLKDSTKIPKALNNIGLIYLDQDSAEKASIYFTAILTKYAKFTNNETQLSALTNIATLLMEKKEYAKALTYYEKCLKVTIKIKDRYKSAILYHNTSRLYRLIYDYGNALKYQHEGLKIAKDIGAVELQQTAYFNFSRIYKAMRNYSKAYTALDKSMELQDSLYKESKTKYRLTEANYERQQREIEIKNLQQESKLNQLKIKADSQSMEDKVRLLLTGLVISILFIITILVLYRDYRMKQRQRSIILEHQLKDSELTALRAQMNPHFIFNALSSIKSYILDSNVEQADYYLGKFAKLIRLILDNSSQNLVPLEKEFQLVESYVELEQLRFENKFVYTIDIQTEMSIMEIFIPSMIIQPFIENAIIHGFLHKDGKCNLQVNVRQQEKSIMIIVEDNGIGRLNAKTKTKNIFHESKGYKMTEQRLKALSQNSETNAGILYIDLSDDSGNTGTRVEILIPLQQSAR